MATSLESIAPEKPVPTIESAKPKGKWGCLFATCGSLLLAVVLIFIAGIVFEFTVGDGVANDPAVVLARAAILLLPTGFLGVGLLVIGIRRLRSQRMEPAAGQQFAEADQG